MRACCGQHPTCVFFFLVSSILEILWSNPTWPLTLLTFRQSRMSELTTLVIYNSWKQIYEKIKDWPVSPWGTCVDGKVEVGCLCPVVAILAYMVTHQSALGPLFNFADGHYLTWDRFVAALQSALCSAGFQECWYADTASVSVLLRPLSQTACQTCWLRQWATGRATGKVQLIHCIYTRTPCKTVLRLCHCCDSNHYSYV